MTSQKYVELLHKKLELHMAVCNCTVFMQSGARCHCAQLVTHFLK